MRITIVGTAYPLRGGIAHYNALLYRELSKKHDVDIVTFRRQYPSLLFPGSTQMESGGEMFRVPSRALVDSINPFNWVSVGRSIRDAAPGLIIFKYWLPFFGPCFGTIARIAKRGTRTKVALICDNVIPHEKRVGDAAFTRYAFRAADYFIVQSDAVERDLLKFWPKAAYRKVPHPIYSMFGTAVDKHQARAALGITAQRVLLFFGYIRRYKGLGVMIEAIAKTDPSLDVHLMVVGEFYDNEERYRKQVAELKLEGRVRFNADYVPNDQVALHFSAADAVVLPYSSATQSGIAQIAYNFDKPVIATAVGGLQEVVLDNITGFIVPPRDAKALAKAIERFYCEEREAEFSARVRQEKQKYSWENLARALEDLAGAQ
jgi:glycosyltransferase involved in cell wall biosynthesis